MLLKLEEHFQKRQQEIDNEKDKYKKLELLNAYDKELSSLALIFGLKKPQSFEYIEEEEKLRMEAIK